jgi:hypothetical protein
VICFVKIQVKSIMQKDDDREELMKNKKLMNH